MKLFYAPNSPYARKARLAARFLGLVGKGVEEVDVTPLRDPNNVLLQYGPSRKVPSLLTDKGAFLTESMLICRHLDGVAGGGKLYPAGDEDVVAIEGLTTGLLDALYWRNHENRRDPGEKSPGFLADEAERSQRCYAALEKLAPTLEGPVTMAQIAVGTCLGYADFRHPGDDWRKGCPKLAAWYEKFAARPEMKETVPPG